MSVDLAREFATLPYALLPALLMAPFQFEKDAPGDGADDEGQGRQKSESVKVHGVPLFSDSRSFSAAASISANSFSPFSHQAPACSTT